MMESSSNVMREQRAEVVIPHPIEVLDNLDDDLDRIELCRRPIGPKTFGADKAHLSKPGMLYRRKRDFEAASAFFFEPTHGLIEPHLKGNTTHLNGKTPMARRNESPLLWQTQFLQKVVVALMLLLSVAAVGHLVAFTRAGATKSTSR